MNYINIKEAKAAYLRGENVTEFLRKKIDCEVNLSEIIEISYDLQAGSYIEFLKANLESRSDHVEEMASIIKAYLPSTKSLIDVGTGEMTTLSLLLSNEDINPASVYAFDTSWSRLYKGMSFLEETGIKKDIELVSFVADTKEIPLASKSIDIVTSSHSLETNGLNLNNLLNELFRICRDQLVLFEPSYELNSTEGKARMDSLGYIKDIEGVVKQLGGVVHDIIPFRNVSNPLNPTACYIIEPPAEITKNSALMNGETIMSVPGTDFQLTESEGFFISDETGQVFPILKGIPILKTSSAILATSLF